MSNAGEKRSQGPIGTNFWVNAIKIKTTRDGDYVGEAGPKKDFAIGNDADLDNLLRNLGFGLDDKHGPWHEDISAVHYIECGLPDGDDLEDYAMVRVELQCVSKKRRSTK